MPSLLSTMQLLQTSQDLRRIKKGRLDGRPLKIKDSRIAVTIEHVEIGCTYEDEGTEHRLHAVHRWDDRENVIQIDEQDVEKDDVDLDFDTHLLRMDLEYRLEFQQGGTLHELVLVASKKISPF